MLMQSARPLGELENPTEFISRHIGIGSADERKMLAAVGESSRRALIDGIVPAAIARSDAMKLPPAVTEAAALAELKAIAGRNQVFRSYIGQGYHDTHTPGVILRNVLENPAWYTAYTPYQAEISQGRLEALVNFQTMVCDLTGMAIANASMLDEATAAAEAMTLARRSVKSRSNTFIVADNCHPQTIEVVRTRARPLGIEVLVGSVAALMQENDCFGVLVQYPSTYGAIDDPRPLVRQAHAKGAAFCVAADLLALTLLVPPGEWGGAAGAGQCRHRAGHHAALRHADGRRRPARGLPRLPRRVQALAARTAGGRQHRQPRTPRLPARAANPRAAHPPREGHVEHLHGPGSARRHRRHVCGLSRSRGPQANRQPGGSVHRRPGQGLAGDGLFARFGNRLRHRHRANRRRHRPDRRPGPCRASQPAPQHAGLPGHLARRNHDAAKTSSCCGRSSPNPGRRLAHGPRSAKGSSR